MGNEEPLVAVMQFVMGMLTMSRMWTLMTMTWYDLTDFYFIDAYDAPSVKCNIK